MNIYQYSEKEQIMTISTKLTEIDLLNISSLLSNKSQEYFDLQIKSDGAERKELKKEWLYYKRLSKIIDIKRHRIYLKSLRDQIK
jgi:hypothetical protein